jgi:phosphoglycerate dehydrogenase-like enzyme
MTDSITRILVSNEVDDQVGREILKGISSVEVLSYDPNADRLTDDQRSAGILLPPYRGSHRPIRFLAELSELRMVQLLSAGADEWAADVPAGVTLATARGAHAGPVSEWVLSAVLAQFRQWPALVRFQDEHIWAHRRYDADTLAEKRALIVGAGAIGNEVARRLSVFGVTSTLVASSARDGIHAAEELPEIVPGHAIVVVAAPLTDKTDRLVDASFLARMDDAALLVNAGRGRIVDTAALVSEVKSGRLRAALDVTDPEPLPSDHPLWDVPGVIISPHSARTVPGTNRLCYEVAAAQISAFLGNQRPANAVNV